MKTENSSLSLKCKYKKDYKNKKMRAFFVIIIKIEINFFLLLNKTMYKTHLSLNSAVPLAFEQSRHLVPLVLHQK